jgi:hypothetical protein
MKRVLIFFIVIFIFHTASAQGNQTVEVEYGGLAYNQGDRIAQLGISFGTYAYGFGDIEDRGFTLPTTASFELGLHEYVSAGAYLGFASWNYSTIDNRFNVFVAGVKGSFHYLPLINEALDFGLEESDWDFYFTLMFGLQSYSWKNDFINAGDLNTTELALSGVLGFRYLFNQNWGIYFEGGRGAIGYLTVGASYTF